MKKVVERWMPSTLAEMRDMINEMVLQYGVDADTTYVEVRDFTLMENTLTDGSTTNDITVRLNF